jgi:hypothetical protein
MLLQKLTFDGKLQICLSKLTTGNAFRLQIFLITRYNLVIPALLVDNLSNSL